MRSLQRKSVSSRSVLEEVQAPESMHTISPDSDAALAGGRESSSTTLDCNPNIQGASRLMALPVDIWERGLLPRCRRHAVIQLSGTCRALRAALAPQVLSRVVLEIPAFAPRTSYHRHSSQSSRDELTAFLQGLQMVFSSPMAVHVRHAVVRRASPEDVVDTMHPSFDSIKLRLYRQRNAWQDRALDHVVAHLCQSDRLEVLHIQTVFLSQSHNRALAGLTKLRALYIDSCVFEQPSDNPYTPLMHLRPSAGVLSPRSLCASLQELEMVGFGNEAMGNAVLELTAPMPALFRATLSLGAGTKCLRSLSAVFPSICLLHLHYSDIDSTRNTARFPLALGTFPKLLELNTTDMLDVSQVSSVRALNSIGIELQNSEDVEEFYQLLADHGSSVQKLVLYARNLSHPDLQFTRIMDSVGTRCPDLECLEITAWEPPLETNQNDWCYLVLNDLRAAVPPVTIKVISLTLGIVFSEVPHDGWRGDLSSVLRSWSVCGEIEYATITIGELDGRQTAMIYDRNVFGRLSNELEDKQYSLHTRESAEHERVL